MQYRMMREDDTPATISHCYCLRVRIFSDLVVDTFYTCVMLQLYT